MSQLLSNLSVGSIVVDPDSSYNGYPIAWKILEHGHSEDGSNLTTLESEYALFDCNWGSTSGWKNSYIRRYLNSTFVNTLSGKLQSNLQSVTKGHYEYDGTGTTTTDKIFLLNWNGLGVPYESYDGSSTFSCDSRYTYYDNEIGSYIDDYVNQYGIEGFRDGNYAPAFYRTYIGTDTAADLIWLGDFDNRDDTDELVGRMLNYIYNGSTYCNYEPFSPSSSAAILPMICLPSTVSVSSSTNSSGYYELSLSYTEKQYLDYEGLSLYDDLMKEYITDLAGGIDLTDYYTKTEVDNLLTAKASTADLQGLATTADLQGLATTADVADKVSTASIGAAATYGVTNTITGSTALATDSAVKTFVEGKGYLTSVAMDVNPSSATTAAYSNGTVWITT